MNILKRVLTAFFTYCVKRNAASCGKIRANRYCAVNSHTRIGDDCHFNGLKIYGQGDVSIGNNVHIAKGAQFFTANHNYEGEKLPYDERVIVQPITIGDNVWIGADVTVLGGVTIGEGAIIQAASCVVKDIPPCGIAGGHPAVVFKWRDKKHYEQLKNDNRTAQTHN